MSSFPVNWNKLKKSHFVRTGLPFLVLVVGASFLTTEFQRVKYDEKKRRSDSKILQAYGIKSEINLETEYQKVQAANENHEWRNIRGPRPYEDNTEFLRNRELQEKMLQEYLEKGEKVVPKSPLQSSSS